MKAIFIKLIAHVDRKPVWVNINNIDYLYRDEGRSCTDIYFCDSGDCLAVKDLPEDIVGGM